jgi:membrane protein implicated in regulation of membrane protease activity
MGLAVMGVSTAMYGSNLPVFVAVFVTLVGAALVAWSLWRWLSPTSARNRFRTSHRQTAGTVIGLDKKEGHSEYGPDWRYYVTVLFGADDANAGTRVLALKAEVAHRIWKGTKHGDTVAIRYAPQDPRIALIQGEW